jgi:hypothetical protein
MPRSRRQRPRRKPYMIFTEWYFGIKIVSHYPKTYQRKALARKRPLPAQQGNDAPNEKNLIVESQGFCDILLQLYRINCINTIKKFKRNTFYV